MKRTDTINTAAADTATTNLIQPQEGAPLDDVRRLLRLIMGVACNEVASEDALDQCGRYAARALSLITEQGAQPGAEHSSSQKEEETFV
jgi:hypothetical protein